MCISISRGSGGAVRNIKVASTKLVNINPGQEILVTDFKKSELTKKNSG
jgi:hypothetical protein